MSGAIVKSFRMALAPVRLRRATHGPGGSRIGKFYPGKAGVAMAHPHIHISGLIRNNLARIIPFIFKPHGNGTFLSK